LIIFEINHICDKIDFSCIGSPGYKEVIKLPLWKGNDNKHATTLLVFLRVVEAENRNKYQLSATREAKKRLWEFGKCSLRAYL